MSRRIGWSFPTAGVTLLLTITGCSGPHGVPPSAAPPDALGVELLRCLTVDGIGSGQGVEVRDGFVYLYGDAETGVIRQYRVVGDPPVDLEYTGVEIKLIKDGRDFVPHPTGLTHHPEHGTFLGNTVDRKGHIVKVDWNRMLADRSLDRAVLHVVQDDAAVDGCRPEFVRNGKCWYVASADYHDYANYVRYYDPTRLARAERTSQPGVLVKKVPCGTHVQNLHWLEAHGALALIQNRHDGDHWRLTFVRPWTGEDYRKASPFDAFVPVNELEGFHMLDDRHCVLVSSARKDNVWLGRLVRR